MNEGSGELIVTWYIELENRLNEILKTILYGKETKDIFLPPLANILLESCSLIDAIFREEYDEDNKGRENLTMRDYSLHFEHKYLLSRKKSILYQYPVRYIEPFKNWSAENTLQHQPTPWWTAYNKIKHDRIREYQNATLENTIFSICALHQIISQMSTFFKALLRHDFICFGDWGKEYVLEAIYDPFNKDVTILVETELFATPVGAARFPENIKKLSPHTYSMGQKLWRYLGKEF